MLRAIVIAALVSVSFAEDEYDCFYDKTVKVKDDESVLKISYDVKKDSDMIFKVDGVVEQKVQIDNEWKIEMIVQQADSEDGEYTDVLAVKNAVCEFMKTIYKNYFWEELKQHSNAPKYDTCPLPPEKYVLKEYPFDAQAYQSLMQPGYFKVILNLYDQNDEIKIGYEFHGHVVEKKYLK